MNSTTQKRRPISIYDYPEHLNPFSECSLHNAHVPDKRKIIVDKIRKNGTWSSKISKKLNRSVSWIEKSWLQVDNSPRRAYESRICNDLHNNALYAKQSQVHNVPVTRRESCSDVRQEIETTLPEYKLNGNSLEKSKSVENLNKCDTRRRKKRPAPRPPSGLRSPSVTERSIVEDPDQEKVINGECETEEKSQIVISLPRENEISPEKIENEISPSHENQMSQEKTENEISSSHENQPSPEKTENEISPSHETETSLEKPQNEISLSHENQSSSEKAQNEIPVPHEDETNVETLNHETVSLKNETTSEENNFQKVPCQEPSNEIDESKLSDQTEHLQIENNVDDEEQSKPDTSCEHDVARVEEDTKREKIIEVQLDENANMPSIKNENCDVKSNHKVSLPADNEL